MAAFRVGQRVRLVQCLSYPEFSGRAAVVMSGLGRRHIRRSGAHEYVHDICIDGVGNTSPAGFQMAAQPWQMEPLIPEGAQPAKWEDCMWQPSAELLAECAA